MTTLFPHARLQREDFAPGNGRSILEKYRGRSSPPEKSTLNAVIKKPKASFVCFFCDCCVLLSLLHLEAFLLPNLPGADRVIRSRESFLRANSGNPLFVRRFVSLLQAV